MAINVLMPKLSFIVTQGTILEWLKKPGDSVNKGESLLVIESEKATVEVEAPGTGVLGSNLAPVGITVPVTTTIGYILEPGEECPELELDAEESVQVSSEGGVVPAGAAADAGLSTQEKADRASEEAPARGLEQSERAHGLEQSERHIKASPAAKRVAGAHGVDLSRIEGSGPRGRIVVDDVLAYVETQTPAEADGERPSAAWVDPTSVQRIAAERMSISFHTAPHFYLSVQVDMSQVVAMREALLPTVEARMGVRLSFNDILVCAVAQALRDHPAMNASFEEGRFKRYQEINIGLAVDTPRGLAVPVLHQADRLSLAELARCRAEVVKRARDNRMTLDDISGGTFTISNLGMFGIDLFSAIINPPQAAILAVGRIARRPVVVEPSTAVEQAVLGAGLGLQVRPTMWMSLSVDHRVADGATGARFLQGLVRYLESPCQMLV